jgi:hypothetical protein
MDKTGNTTNNMPSGSPAASLTLADAKADAMRQEQASAALGAVRTDAWAVRAGADGPADSAISTPGPGERGGPVDTHDPQPKRKSAKKPKPAKSILDATPCA